MIAVYVPSELIFVFCFIHCIRTLPRFDLVTQRPLLVNVEESNHSMNFILHLDITIQKIQFKREAIVRT